MLEEARLEAGLSLERAAGMAYLDRKALRRRETGEIQVTPDEVCTLAEAYKNQQLKHWYCSVCKIGKEMGRIYDPVDATLAMLRFLRIIEDMPKIKQVLMDILEDGKITEDELPLFEEVCKKLAYMKQCIDALVMAKGKSTPARVPLR
jgi:predicted transcriptional regulator